MDNLKEIKDNFLKIDTSLSEFATRSLEAERIVDDIEDYRTPFFRDIDRIIYSLSYTRYIDKTQVYSFKDNDHISKRIIHVGLVNKIARTIGRALGLNTDLIEAIALGHDIGHTPLGHTGESFLNEISLRETGEYFCHNVQSMRNLEYVENHGRGLNLTIQVLDGILCHNGEELLKEYHTESKTKEDVINQYNMCYKDKKYNNKFPMTLEGCIVRLSDIISYLGRDVEDAERLGLLDKNDIPLIVKNVLGTNNKEIVNTIVTDVIENSIGKPYIKLSDQVYAAMKELMDFNYKNIYYKAMSSELMEYYRDGMNTIYGVYKKAIEDEELENEIYNIFLNGQDAFYLENTSNDRKVIDFIAGMTDDYFIQQVKKYKKDM